MADLDARMVESMAEYEAIGYEAATEFLADRIVPINAAHSYTLGGIQTTDNPRCIVIEQGQKAVRR